MFKRLTFLVTCFASAVTIVAQVNAPKIRPAFEPSQSGAGSPSYVIQTSQFGIKLEKSQFVITTRTVKGTRRLSLEFEGALPGASLEGVERQSGVSNYIIGNDPRNWNIGVPRFSRVTYRNLFPGVDLSFYTKENVEHDFVVKPGADPHEIRLKVNGARRLQIDAEGNLSIELNEGRVSLHKPHLLQINATRTEEVTGGFVLLSKNSFGFVAGSYDKRRELIIDPIVSYVSYLGGNKEDTVEQLAVDDAGSAYVAGHTDSTDFPMRNAVNLNCNCTTALRLFVTKLTPDGSDVVYSTYFGGTERQGTDSIQAIGADASGNVVFGGVTTASDFPVQNPIQTYPQLAFNGSHGYLSSLDTNGTIRYSTYIGGSGQDSITSIAITSTGNAVASGVTSSADFPITAGTLSSTVPGYPIDSVFLISVRPTGTLAFSTVLPATPPSTVDSYTAPRVAVDAGDYIYLLTAAKGSLPTTTGAYQAINKGTLGAPNVYVAKINPVASSIVWATWAGNTYATSGSLAVDTNKAVYFTALAPDFPLTSSTYKQFTINGVVAKLSASGDQLVWATALPASNLVADGSGNVYLTGSTTSDFPLVNPIQQWDPIPTRGVWFGALDPSGTSLWFSSFLAGTVYGTAAIARSPDNHIYVAGETTSSILPTTPGAFQESATFDNWNTLLSHGFVSKFDLSAPGPAICLSPGSVDLRVGYGVQSPAKRPITVQNCGTVPMTPSVTVGGNSDLSQTNDCTTVAPGQQCTVNAALLPTDFGEALGILTVRDAATNHRQSVYLNGFRDAAFPVFDPGSLVFGSQVVNSSSDPLRIQLSNSGTSPMSLSSISTTGEFTQTNDCGTNLDAQRICFINVVFSPTTSSARGGSLVFVDGAPHSPHSLLLQGTGQALASGPSIFLSQANLAFATVYVGDSSTEQVSRIISAGQTPLQISNITASTDFSVSNDCPASLPGSSSCNVRVKLKPATYGTKTGTITITHNAGNPSTINVTGTAMDFKVEAASNSLTVTRGNSVSTTITLTGFGVVNDVAILSCSGVPAQSGCFFENSSMVPFNGGVQTKMTVATTAPSSTSPVRNSAVFFLGFSLLAGLLLVQKPRRSCLPTILLVGAISMMTSCGGSGGGTTPPSPTGGTPAGTYTLKVNATIGSDVRSTSVTLVVQ